MSTGELNTHVAFMVLLADGANSFYSNFCKIPSLPRSVNTSRCEDPYFIYILILNDKKKVRDIRYASVPR